MSIFNLRKKFTRPSKRDLFATLKTLSLLFMGLLILSPSPVQALSDFYDSSEIQFYDDQCETESSTVPSAPTGPIKNVFVVGDSITYTAKLPPHNMKQAFQEKGINAVISGSAGGTIEKAGTKGDPYSGLEAVEHYRDSVKNADVVIVALGTNHFSSGFGKSIRKMVNKVKAVNDSAAIYWVNTYTKDTGAYSAASSTKKNNTIANLSSSLGYDVIDITNVGIKLNADKIHPEFDESGIGVWRDTIVDTMSDASVSSDEGGDGATPGGGIPTELVGHTDAEKAFNYLRGTFGEAGAAGIVGNLMWEVGGGEEALPTDLGSSHRGIAQWDNGRYANLIGYANKKGLEPTDLIAQLGFIVKEMSKNGDYASVGKKVKKTTKPEKASDVIYSEYEKPGDGSNGKRADAAKEIYNKYSSGEAPDPSGDTESGDTVCCNTADSIDIAPGEGSPVGVTFPSLDPAKMADAINKYITKTVPSSPYKNLGPTIVASSKKNNLNPFLIVGIAQMETTIGTAGNAPETHSAFNRRAASGQPSAGGWYKYSAFKASVDSEAPENQGEKRGDITTYMRNSGFYDSGLKSGKLYDIMSVYAPPSENDTDQYVKNLKNWIKKMVTLTDGSDAAGSVDTVSDEGGAATSCSCSDVDNGSVNGGGLKQSLEKLAKDNGGNTTISVSSDDGDLKADYSGDTQKQTRSSYKIYVAYGIIRAIEAGKLSWGTRIPTTTDGGQTGSGTVSDQMKQMIIDSNNGAAAALRTRPEFGGPTGLTKELQNDIGLSKDTVMGTGVASDAKGTNSQSTANDFVKFLTLLKKNKLKGITKQSNYNKLIGLMKQAKTDSGRSGIVAGVGSGTEVADKPGWSSGAPTATNDVGVVYLKGNNYALAILTDNPSPSGFDGIAKIAKSVNSLMKGNSDLISDSGCGGAVPGDLLATVKNYAWPTHHDKPYVKAKPEYASAVKKHQAKGEYVGGIAYPGIDCGGFITIAMTDSGFEPKYNSSGKGGATPEQESWLKANWQKINPKKASDLEPGDVAITNAGQQHTYMYVGKVPGFHSTIASASLDGRAPMAGEETPADSAFGWYRKK